MLVAINRFLQGYNPKGISDQDAKKGKAAELNLNEIILTIGKY
jgi:hypothetical protein